MTNLSNNLCLLAGTKAAQILLFLQEKGIEAYIVGGFIRDSLLGRGSDDVDIAVRADSKDVSREIAGRLDGKFVPLDEERGVYRIVLKEQDRRFDIDITTIKEDIYKDLAERDFTIDAMASSVALSEDRIEAGEIIDPFNGQADLKSHTIRAVNEDIFTRDPARLLRAYRMASEIDFTIDEKTEELIKKSSHLLRSVAGERVREELMGIMSLKKTALSLKKMDSSGLLDELFPELASGKGVAQPGWHIYDVFEHSIATVQETERILQSDYGERQSDPLLSVLRWDEETENHFTQEICASVGPRYALDKLAGLLHDISKPQTKTLAGDGRAHFYGHTKMGAEVARSIMERMRFSNREMDLMEIVVGNHLRPTQMGDATGDGKPSKKAIYRFFRDTGEASLDILYLSLADYLASKGKDVDRKGWEENVGLVHYILDAQKEIQTVTRPPRLIDGHDLMKEFSLSPGPLVGELLEKVEEARALGQISTEEEALALVNALLSKKNI